MRPVCTLRNSLTNSQIEGVAALLEAVRDAVEWNVGIALDCHGRFTRRGAIEVTDALEQYDIFFLEEPVELEDGEVMVEVTKQVNMPVATGERISTTKQWLTSSENRVVISFSPMSRTTEAFRRHNTRQRW